MAKFETGILEGMVTDILVAAGAPHGRAMEVARSLVLSNLMGTIRMVSCSFPIT